MKNKLFKRIIAIFTAMLILGTYAFAGNIESESDDYKESEETTIYEEFEALYKLGITGEYPKDEFSPYENITLGEFYGMVLNIMSDNAVKNINNSEEAKNAAIAAGLAYEDENFSASVSCIDAVKILLKLTGSIYRLEVENKNITEEMYMTEAKKSGILEGVNIASGKILDKITAMRIVLNVIDVKFTEVLWYGAYNQVKSIKKTERTVIEQYRNVHKVKGVVTATYDASLYDVIGTDEGSIAIDGNVYKCEADYRELLGFSIKGYLQENRSEPKKILYLYKSDKQSELFIDAEDIAGVSENLKSITYYNSNKKKQISISPTLRVIYNGSYLEKFTSFDLIPEIGNIHLIDNNYDSKFDVLSITDYSVMAVASLNSGVETIYGRIPAKGESENFYYGDFEKIDVYKNNEMVRISEIKRDDVLSIVIPKNIEGRLKIYICDKVLTGDVSRIDSRNNEIIVEGKRYKLSKALLEDVEKGRELYPAIGKTYVIHFDIFGEAAFLEVINKSSLSYGFMRAIGTKGGLDNTYEVRIFTTDNKWITKTLNEKLRLNGENLEADKAYEKIAPFGVFAPMLIMFGINSEGIINRIETPIVQENVDEERLISGGVKTRTYQGHMKSLGYYDVYVGVETEIMVVPADYSNEDAYIMMSTNKLSDNTPYVCTPYNLDKFRVADLIVMNESSELLRGNYQSEMCVVTDKGSVINSDGIGVECLVVNSGSYSDLVITASYSVNFDNVKIGDVISARFNNKSEAEEIRIWYSSSDGLQYLYPTTENAINQVLSGRVIDINSDRSIIRIECGEKECCMKTMDQGTAVAFYDYKINKARTGTFAEVAPGDFIVFRMTEMLMKRAVVIENLN